MLMFQHLPDTKSIQFILSETWIYFLGTGFWFGFNRRGLSNA